MNWFDEYSDSGHTGVSESVCGSGQLCKVGKASEVSLTFHPTAAVEYTKR